MILFEPGGLGDKLDLEFVTWLYVKTPGMLRLLSKRYVKLTHASLEKLLRSIYVGGTEPTDPDRLVSVLRDEGGASTPVGRRIWILAGKRHRAIQAEVEPA